MNVEEFKNLKIKCICNSFLYLASGNVIGYTCLNMSCAYFANKTYLVNICSNESIEINLFNNNKDISYGFVSSNHEEDSISDSDVILDIDEIIKIIHLCDVKKYIEKYESLILFK